MSNYPRSDRQADYVSDLLAKRVVPEALAEQIKLLLPTCTSSQASGWIDALKGYAYKPKPGAGDAWAEFRAAVEGIPDSRYAIPVRHLQASFPHLNFNGDLFFIRVSTFKGKRYLRRLAGGVGDWQTYPLSVEDATRIAKLLNVPERLAEGARLFADNFKVCAKCLSPLTDPVSRAAGLGPICRDSF